MAGSRNKPCIEPVLSAVQACLARHALPSEGVTVAFSGGMDSMVLLHAVDRMARAAGAPITAIHVHHGLSPNADRWADFCRATCRRLAVPLRIERIQVAPKRGEGLESAARRARRAALLGSAEKWILLAQHADDQAETLLLNLLRGSGVRGAAGMPERHGRILRPLLGLLRQDLSGYARLHGLGWVEDESNRDVRFTRNYLRAEVFPALQARYPAFARKLATASSRFAEASGLLEELARIDLGDRIAAFPIPSGLLLGLSEARARNLIRSLLGWNGLQAPDERKLSEFVRQVRSAGQDRAPRLVLPAYSLERRRGMVNCRTVS